MEFAKILKDLRIEKGLKQIELGKMLNVTDTAIWGWETGRREPSLSTVCKLANIFDVSVGQLLGVEELY